MHKNIPNTIHNPLPTISRTMEITGKVGHRCCGAGGAGDKRQRQRAAVTVARPAAAAREAKEGPTPAAGEETQASWRP